MARNYCETNRNLQLFIVSGGCWGEGMVLELSFPGSTSADANMLASELRSELADHGVPPSALKVVRVSPEHMDLGTTIEIAKIGLETLVAAHAAYNFGHVIFEFSRRTKSVVKIKSPTGNIDFTTDKTDPSELARIFQKLAELQRERKR